jgi:hypothetical protein
MFKLMENIKDNFLCLIYNCDYILSGKEFNRRKLFLCTRFNQKSIINENTYFVEPKNIDFTLGNKILFLKVDDSDKVYFYKNKKKIYHPYEKFIYINKEKIKVRKFREDKFIENDKDFYLDDYYTHKQLNNIYKNDYTCLCLKYVKNKTKNLCKIASNRYLSNIPHIPVKYKDLNFYHKTYSRYLYLSIRVNLRRDENKLKKTYSYYIF